MIKQLFISWENQFDDIAIFLEIENSNSLELYEHYKKIKRIKVVLDDATALVIELIKDSLI